MSATRMLLGLLVVLSSAATAAARPPYKSALADYFGPFLAKPLAHCRTCHLPTVGEGEAAERPHNTFGARLAEVRRELSKAGKPADIAARIAAISDEDSDHDGTSNLLELLSGRAPGDPADKPTQAEVQQAQASLPAFRKYLARYPWRPLVPPAAPPVPTLANHPIDAFLAASQADLGLKPVPEADKATLLRRVTFDLIGLPPTVEQQRAFLADNSPDAFERVVDRLLASPQYGERWGRHWLDVWRYSDWAGWGNQVRDSQPNIWRWRDWVVESLNADKGYDRMIWEMLAGDELAPTDPATLRATGFLVRNYKLLSRERWMQDAVDHTFLAFQGLTVGCARCHDHMYDPITQKEYYQLRAIFEPHNVRTDRLPGLAPPPAAGLVRVYDAAPTAPTYFLERGDDRMPDKSATIPPGVPAALGGQYVVQPVPLPRRAYQPDRTPEVTETVLKQAHQAITTAQVNAQKPRDLLISNLVLTADLWSNLVRLRGSEGLLLTYEIAQANVRIAETAHAALEAVVAAERLEDAGQSNSPAGRAAAEKAQIAQRAEAVARAEQAWLTARLTVVMSIPKNQPSAEKNVAAALTNLQKARQAEAAPLTGKYTPRPMPTYPATSTGRRLALARWLTANENPLTARVAVNHIWLRHFGQALVPSTFDFGRNGRAPTQAPLLDWLAVEFRQRNWSMKSMHKLIVTSAAYRRASYADETNLAKDRDNLHFWRMLPRRLEAEVVRDSLFFVAGKLDLTLGGADIDHNLGLTVPRRSLYFRHAAEKQMEFLKLFDAPSVTECYQRKDSVMPQQALALANSELAIRHSRLVARRLSVQASEPSEFIRLTYQHLLGRFPKPAEEQLCLAYLAEQASTLPSRAGQDDPNGAQPATAPTLRARESLVAVLLNHNDFVTVR